MNQLSHNKVEQIIYKIRERYVKNCMYIKNLYNFMVMNDK